MFFLSFLLLIFISWLLWNICQNTNDALDKQTAIQYEIVSLEKRLEEVLEKLEGAPEEVKTEGNTSSETVVQNKLSINDASVNELSSLPRIGKALAQRIIDNRPYEALDDLQKVQGISKDLFIELQDKVLL